MQWQNKKYKDTQEMQQSWSTALPMHQKKGRRGTNHNKDTTTYE